MHRLFVLPLLLATGLAAAADVTMTVQCAVDDAPPASCEFGDTATKDGTHTMEFVQGGRRTRFVGRKQSGWWSGQLDGRPAMGYELNRGHFVFSTADLETRFEWWSEGARHGEY